MLEGAHLRLPKNNTTRMHSIVGQAYKESCVAEAGVCASGAAAIKHVCERTRVGREQQQAWNPVC